jgi:uncharacterized RDD family membrane protein YckC
VESRQWHYVLDGNQMGPIDESVLVQRLASGQLSTETLVWTQTLEDWVSAASVPELTHPVSIPEAEPPPDLPVSQSLHHGPAVVFYAGFWLRVAASLVDGLILTGVGMVVGAVVGLFYGLIAGSEEGAETLGLIVGVLVRWVYFAVMESSVHQATLGKLALGLKVTDLNGDPISFSRASGRHFGKLLSALTLGAGYLMVAFTERKQGLHDIMASCLVIRR